MSTHYSGTAKALKINSTHDLCFEQKKKKINKNCFHLTSIIFTAVKVRSTIHRRVIVMSNDCNAIEES